MFEGILGVHARSNEEVVDFEGTKLHSIVFQVVRKYEKWNVLMLSI